MAPVTLMERRLEGDGGSVVLDWLPSTDAVTVIVQDAHGMFTIETDRAGAMEAFHHPYLFDNREQAQYIHVQDDDEVNAYGVPVQPAEDDDHFIAT